jgi:hypothetical protein
MTVGVVEKLSSMSLMRDALLMKLGGAKVATSCGPICPGKTQRLRQS